MLDFYEKRTMRSILYSKPVIVLLAAIIFMLIYSVWGVYVKERETFVKKNQRAQVLGELLEREQILEEEINRLNTVRGIDEEIRSKFEVAQEGEEMIVIVEEKKASNDGQVRKEKSLWDTFREFF